MSQIKHHITGLWQQQYDKEQTGASYKRLEPRVSGKIKYENRQRDKEVMLTRLRLGRCRLASYLHAIGCHQDGLCSTCHQRETIEHLLMHCTKYNIASHLINSCNRLKVKVEINTILTNPDLINETYKIIKENKLHL